MNKTTGKESTRLTDFNEANWGLVTSGFIQSIKTNLSSDAKFAAIVSDAKNFAKVNQRADATATPPTVHEQEYEERALLRDDTTDEE